ncbi:MAG: hypothetical protein ACYC6N_31035, partial [Pirellulaceae bacterium]
MRVDDAVAAVRHFHRGTGSPIADKPRLLPGDRHVVETLAGQLSTLKSGIDTSDGGMLVQRAAMAIEELVEWLQANVNGDLVAAARRLGGSGLRAAGRRRCCWAARRRTLCRSA